MVGSGLLISMLKTLNLFRLTRLITGAIDVKMNGSVFEGKSYFKILWRTLYIKLDWGSSIVSIAKTSSKRIGALICNMNFLSLEVALYLYKSTTGPCTEYCCHVWASAPKWYLDLLNKIHKQICRPVRPSLAASFEPSAHCQNVGS